jgi:hypothetical protein
LAAVARDAQRNSTEKMNASRFDRTSTFLHLAENGMTAVFPLA